MHSPLLLIIDRWNIRSESSSQTQVQQHPEGEDACRKEVASHEEEDCEWSQYEDSRRNNQLRRSGKCGQEGTSRLIFPMLPSPLLSSTKPFQGSLDSDLALPRTEQLSLTSLLWSLPMFLFAETTNAFNEMCCSRRRNPFATGSLESYPPERHFLSSRRVKLAFVGTCCAQEEV